jgi:Zn finger protein HypA/HybF involved in hydrogenase expression
MHELSIALGIVQLAEDEVNKANARQVDTIELEIGAFSGY